MGQKLSPSEMQLYHRVDEILHYIWDPIGISRYPEARDEYDSYLPKVFLMLKNTKDGKDIKDFLREIESERMGLGTMNRIEERLDEVLQILLYYRKITLGHDSSVKTGGTTPEEANG